MKDWWPQRPERERRLLLIGGAVLLAGLFYGLLWAPLQRAVHVRSERVSALRADLQWMRGAAVQLLALRAQSAPAGAAAALSPDTPLASAVADAARAAALANVIKATDAGKNRLTLDLQPLPFATLLPWLAALQAQGIDVRSLDLQAAGEGMVRGRIELARTAAEGDGGQGQ